MADQKRVFVFGSNTEGRHGAGAALHARRHWGACYGQAEGRQGDSYGIITKELRRGYPAITLDQVGAGIIRFLLYTQTHPDTTFLITRIGCGLAGFKDEEIALFFREAGDNCRLPPEWGPYLSPLDEGTLPILPGAR